MSLLRWTLAPAFQEQALPRKTEQLCRLGDPAARRVHRVLDERLLQLVRRLFEGLVEADADGRPLAPPARAAGCSSP